MATKVQFQNNFTEIFLLCLFSKIAKMQSHSAEQNDLQS